MPKYLPDVHTHNFACWTAAAAVRRGFTTNEVIASAIDTVQLKEWADSLSNKFDDFGVRHDDMCQAIVDALKTHSSKAKEEKQTEFIDKCTFGWAAKIVSIYLKTYMVIPSINDTTFDPLLKSIYQPIDQMLLDGIIAQQPKLKTSLKDYKWTKATKYEYLVLKKTITVAKLPFNWKLEEHWKGHRSSDEE